MNYKKDYSLLRPFDLEAAKAGELLIDSDYDAVGFVGSATKSDEVCVEINSSSLLIARPEDLFMAPLAWVEGRPVYRGDVLYGRSSGEKYIADDTEDTDLFTWQKPKTKREGWVNILPASYHKYPYGYIYPSEQEAKEYAPDYTIATAYVSWEE